jgi:DNA repair exonuclease SbcCD nuclease subunit
MRLLHFADLHLDTPFRWAPPQLARARRAGLRATLGRIVELARDQRVDALTCGGDLYEQERVTPDTVAYLQSTFASLDPVPVLLAPGNHDWLGPDSPYARAAWSPNVHIFTRDRLTPYELADGCTVWGAAHRAPANTAGFLDDFAVPGSGVHIGVFHASQVEWPAGQSAGQVPHAPFHAEQITRAGLTHALLGHFHTPRDTATHTYPGNPDPLTFGETGRRGAVLLTVSESGQIRTERYDVATAAVHDLTVDVTGASHADEVRQQVLAAVEGLTGAVRVTLTGELGDEVDLRLDLLAAACPPWLDVLVPRVGVLRPGYDLQALAGQPTVRGQFVRDVLAADLDDDQRRRVLVTGLRALDGRADELDVA